MMAQLQSACFVCGTSVGTALHNLRLCHLYSRLVYLICCYILYITMHLANKVAIYNSMLDSKTAWYRRHLVNESTVQRIMSQDRPFYSHENSFRFH